MWFLLVGVFFWGWFWNVGIGIEGQDLHTAWTVTGGDATAYNAEIIVHHPTGADVDILEVADNERVRLSEDHDLACTAEGVEVEVSYFVNTVGKAKGQEVEVALVINPDTEDQTSIGPVTGEVRKWVTVSGFIETDEAPSCATD